MFWYNVLMSLWQTLLAWLGLAGDRQAGRTFEVSQRVEVALNTLARQTGVPEPQLAEDLILAALQRLHTQDELWQRWLELTPREQQVVALTCLGYTNRQIAAQLSISPETVKTHLRHALIHFNLHSKNELRQALADWDFSGWAAPPQG